MLHPLCGGRLLLLLGFAITPVTANPGLKIYCREGNTQSKTECLLEENTVVTRAFTYEIVRGPDGKLPTRTEYCDVEYDGNSINFLPGCNLKHLPDMRQYPYENRGDIRVVGLDRARPFKYITRTPKSMIKLSAKAHFGLEYSSMEPLASLSVSKKGALTWVENYGPKEEAKWLKLDGHKSTKASPYFKLPDGRIGFFIAYHAVVLGNGITVLHDLRNYHDSRIFTGAR